MICEVSSLTNTYPELPAVSNITDKVTNFGDLSNYRFNNVRLLRDYMIVEFNIQSEIIPILNTELGIDSNTPTPLYTANVKNTVKSLHYCPICYKDFTSQQGRNQHLGKKHSNTVKSSLCEACGKTFSHKYALKFHYQQVHETLKRVNCEQCSYVAYNKYKLKKHMKKHLIKKTSL